MPRPILFVVLLLACQPTDPGDDPKGTPTPEPKPTRPTTEPTVTLPTVTLPPLELTINELMARNDSTWVAPDGTRSDWLELVNLGDEPAQLSRVRITDITGNEWRGSGSLGVGERIVLAEADLGFAIDSDEDLLTLFVDGEAIQAVEVLDLERDVSLARTPDLDGDFLRTAWPTPGEPNLTEVSPTLDAADLHVFVADRVHRIDFTLTPQAFDILNSRDEGWAMASMTFDDMTFEQVGVRLKGSASFDLMDGKPAFKVDMNRGVPGQRMKTLKGFNLHNGNVMDPTRARDHTSYTLAREGGIMAPRVGWAEVYFNGMPYFIYMIIEQHDDVMIERNFAGMGNTGVMFEPNESRSGGWGGDFGSGSADQWDMEEGPIPPDPLVVTALQTADDLVASQASDANVAELWNHVDKDNLLTYMAWESIVSHTDGYKAPNNWRVFVHPVDYKVHLVPAGAEWTWDNNPDTLRWGGRLADWCLDNRGCRMEYGARALELAELVTTIDLQGNYSDVSTMLVPYIAADTRSPHGSSTVNTQRQQTFDNILAYPAEVAREVCNDMPTLVGCN